MNIDENRAVKLAADLISLDGVSGEEGDVADFIEEQARKAGVKKSWITRDAAHKRIGSGNTGNLVITVPGSGAGKRILFSAHMDTVEIARGSVPVRKGNYIYPQGDTALGADNRAGVAALVNGLVHIVQTGEPRPPLTFLFTVQEEIGLFGARYTAVSKLKNPAMCYNVDGRDPGEIVLKAPSSSVFTATVRGRAAHAGQHPDRGVSAALIFTGALAEVRDKNLFGHIERKGKKAATSNIGTVEGGTASNIVMDTLRIKGEARSYSDKLLERIIRTYKQSLEKAARSVKSTDGACGSVEFGSERIYTAFSVAKSSEPVRRLVSVLGKFGAEPVYPEMFGGLDANWLNSFSIPTVTIGAGGQNPHTKDECLSIRDYLTACRTVLGLIRS